MIQFQLNIVRRPFISACLVYIIDFLLQCIFYCIILIHRSQIGTLQQLVIYIQKTRAYQRLLQLSHHYLQNLQVNQNTPI